MYQLISSLEQIGTKHKKHWLIQNIEAACEY